MQTNRPEFLRQYHYDPLDRLVASSSSAQATALRFYQRERLANEIQGSVQRSIMQHDDQPLAQQTRQGRTAVETSLLATDPQRSVLNVVDATQPHRLAYTPYGYRPLGHGLLSLLGFNGERPDQVTGWYLLGTGYHRPFNPVLGRFICPDSWSPFRDGGLNAYAYCAGDPVNRADASGHALQFLRRIIGRLGGSSGTGYKRISEKTSVDRVTAPIAIAGDAAGASGAGFRSAADSRRVVTAPPAGPTTTTLRRQLVSGTPQKYKNKLVRLERAENELNALTTNPEQVLIDLRSRLSDDFVPDMQIQLAVRNAEFQIPTRIEHLNEKIRRLGGKIEPYMPDTFNR